MPELRAPGTTTAHVDTFCRDLLPPPELWPEMDYGGLPELAYPDRLNCAAELLDARVAAEGVHMSGRVSGCAELRRFRHRVPLSGAGWR